MPPPSRASSLRGPFLARRFVRSTRRSESRPGMFCLPVIGPCQGPAREPVGVDLYRKLGGSHRAYSSCLPIVLTHRAYPSCFPIVLTHRAYPACFTLGPPERTISSSTWRVGGGGDQRMHSGKRSFYTSHPQVMM